MTGEAHVLRCECGAVECVGTGQPIGTAVCYCNDCQAAARQIEALSGAPPLMDPDGGTALTLFRKTRFAVTRGEDRLAPHRLRSDSETRRMIATCCNSAMFLAFDGRQHWVSAACNRIVGDRPRIEFRHMIRYRTSTLPFPDSVPIHRGFPLRFVARVMGDWLAMKLGR